MYGFVGSVGQSRRILAAILHTYRPQYTANSLHTGAVCYGDQAAQNAVFKPLDGVRVLDLSRVLAGPYCTMLMGDMGADVIKVERIDCGDDTRTWGPPWVSASDGSRHSAYFLSINRNKQSIAVDLKKSEGSKIIQQLAKSCDILVENYIPGKLAEMGLGYEQLHAIAPRLVYTSITGFGQTGPYCDRGGYDNIAAAIGGLMHITGAEDGGPCRVGVAMTDLSTGLYALSASMAAYLHSQRTGRGQHVDCNLLNTQVATLTHIASNYLNCGVEAKRHGTGHGSIVPYQTFQTWDGQHLMVGAGNEKLFTELCQVIGLNDLVNDERFSNNERRVANRKDMVTILSERFSQKTMAEWMTVFKGSSVPYGRVNSMEQVFTDPQVLHNDMVQTMSHAALGDIRVPGPAVRYGEGDLQQRYSPPILGQHTRHILSRLLGYTDIQIASLQGERVIQCTELDH